MSDPDLVSKACAPEASAPYPCALLITDTEPFPPNPVDVTCGNDTDMPVSMVLNGYPMDPFWSSSCVQRVSPKQIVDQIRSCDLDRYPKTMDLFTDIINGLDQYPGYVYPLNDLLPWFIKGLLVEPDSGIHLRDIQKFAEGRTNFKVKRLMRPIRLSPESQAAMRRYIETVAPYVQDKLHDCSDLAPSDVLACMYYVAFDTLTFIEKITDMSGIDLDLITDRPYKPQTLFESYAHVTTDPVPPATNHMAKEIWSALKPPSEETMLKRVSFSSNHPCFMDSLEDIRRVGRLQVAYTLLQQQGPYNINEIFATLIRELIINRPCETPLKPYIHALLTKIRTCLQAQHIDTHALMANIIDLNQEDLDKAREFFLT
ncbi:MAG: hypothetical protein VW378_08015 [bacterium]